MCVFVWESERCLYSSPWTRLKWSLGKVLMTSRPRHSSFALQPRSTITKHSLLSLPQTYSIFVPTFTFFSFHIFSHLNSLSFFLSSHMCLLVDLYSPPWEWGFLLDVFLSDRGVIEDVCLTAVFTEEPWECVYLARVCTWWVVITTRSEQFHRVFAVSFQLSVVCMQTVCM